MADEIAGTGRTRTGRGNGVWNHENRCPINGCSNHTTFHKAYCIDHLDKIPEIARISDENREREREAQSIDVEQPDSWRKINPNGSRANEIVALVEQRAMSPKKLGVMVDLDMPRIHAYLKALAHAGRLCVHALGSRRGQLRYVVSVA